MRGWWFSKREGICRSTSSKPAKSADIVETTGPALAETVTRCFALRSPAMRNGPSSSIPFELTGKFGGFIYTDAGKRRMVLRVGEREYLLKVPKELRRRVIANFRSGEEVFVTGVEERDAVTGVTSRWLVARMQSAASVRSREVAPSWRGASGPILVCVKKNCWRAGGRELWHALERELDTQGLATTTELKAVHCLDRCKHAPNAEWRGCAFRRCAPADAVAIVACAAASVARRGLV